MYNHERNFEVEYKHSQEVYRVKGTERYFDEANGQGPNDIRLTFALYVVEQDVNSFIAMFDLSFDMKTCEFRPEVQLEPNGREHYERLQKRLKDAFPEKWGWTLKVGKLTK